MSANECRFTCPNCGTEVVSVVPGEKKCEGAGCPYFFQVFSKRDRDEARNAYLLRPSKLPKYLHSAPDERWFVGFTEKAEPFIAETLCDLISAPVLQTVQEGLAKRLRRAITLLVRLRNRPSSSEGIKLIEGQGQLFGRIDPIDTRAYFARRCSAIRDPPDGKGDKTCLLFDVTIAKEMIEKNDPGKWKPRWYPCWAGLIDFVAPIVINDFIAAVMFTGQTRWTDPEGESSLCEGNRKVASTVDLSEQEARQLADLPEQARMNRSELDAFLRRFTEQVEIIKALAESRYWAERRVRESEFLSEVFAWFAPVDDEDSLWRVVGAVLGRINEFSLFAHSAFFFLADERAEGYLLKASAGCESAKRSVLELSHEESERIFQKEALYRVREAQETKDAGLYAKILQFLGIDEVNCAFLFPFVLGDSRRGVVLLAQRTNIAPDRISRGAVSSRRLGFLEQLIHEIKIEVQNSLHIADLRKALQDRSDFMATAGHLLVAPLDAAYGKTERIKSLAEKALEAAPTPDAQRIAQLCDDLDKDITYCVRRTRGFMFFTTMGTTAESYRFDRVISLPDILAECKRDFEHLADTRGISIALETHGDIPSACFDGEKLQIAFSNLLDNAVKYSHSNRAIYLELRYDKSAEVYTTFISDFGLGIPPEEQETIFAPYRRSRLQDPRRFIPGTGIGLSVVRRIISRHGGKVSVTSKQGEDASGSGSSSVEGFNTTFWVQLHRRRRRVE